MEGKTVKCKPRCTGGQRIADLARVQEQTDSDVSDLTSEQFIKCFGELAWVERGT